MQNLILVGNKVCFVYLFINFDLCGFFFFFAVNIFLEGSGLKESNFSKQGRFLWDNTLCPTEF